MQNLKKLNKLFLIILFISISNSCNNFDKKKKNTLILKSITIDFVINKLNDCRFSRLEFKFVFSNATNHKVMLQRARDFDFCNSMNNETFIRLKPNFDFLRIDTIMYKGDFNKLSLKNKKTVIKPFESKEIRCILCVDIYAFSLNEINNDLNNYFQLLKSMEKIEIKNLNIKYKQAKNLKVIYKLDDKFVSEKDSLKMKKSIPHKLFGSITN